MIADLGATGRIDVPPGAVVVVGSGAAGLALTERLADAGRAVVLLESGADVATDAAGDVPDDDRNAGTVSGAAYTGLQSGRARVLGGTGQLWHGQCMRLHDIDLERRPWVAHSGWPLSKAELVAHYPAAEAWLGVSGRGYGGERWQEHRDLEPLEWDARRVLHDFTEYTPRPMLGREHRARLAADPSVRAYVNATVTAVHTDYGRVVGLEVAGPDGRRVAVAADTVVVAGGAIENARLLQLSDPAGVGLGPGREHVGRYLQDHPVATTAEIRPHDYRLLQDRYVALHRGRRRLFPKVRLAPAAQRERELLDATAVFFHEHDEPGLDAARRLVLAARAGRVTEHALRDVRTALGSPVPVVRDTVRRYARGLATGTRPSRITLQVWLEQEPDADSRLTLGTDRDALGLRRANVHWRIGDREIETSRLLTRWIAEDLARLGVASVRFDDAMYDDDVWRAGVRDAFHPAGTTRMSTGPADGVVDPDLQVHGVRGLHVVGGSVFPTSGYANPTLTIVALALRLADHLVATAVPAAPAPTLVAG